MNSSVIKDVLSWEKFQEETLKETVYPPKTIELYNRLVASTNNFFVIAAIGAFVPGYLMIISKKLIPSLALIEDSQLDELHWLIRTVTTAISNTYKKEVAMFEHGMCACIGGLDRAHLHMMPMSKGIKDNTIIECINRALLRRRAGISSVEVDGYKFENIHDITEIMNGSEKNSYKINGKQLYYEDIKENLEIKNWPFSTRPLVLKGGHYVFFKTSSSSSSFLTDKNFQTQLGREIVFEIEKENNPTIIEMNQRILKKNSYANIWKWQEFSFKENIYKTMSDLTDSLIKVFETENKFNFKASFKR
jgi:diadenosine tetraphosphate (Ap4A) HIT family hydrolase